MRYLQQVPGKIPHVFKKDIRPNLARQQQQQQLLPLLPQLQQLLLLPQLQQLLLLRQCVK